MTDTDSFIDFIVNLPCEGETALLLRQTPIKVDGAIQYHADGAPKANFPAFLPEKVKIKQGDAWYVNTGAFILDRFSDGKVSAKRENCEYVLFMMLDDIGTKSKTPPLDPTWIMETSPGSFQWGYVFSEQPTKGDFSAAIKAIADAGYTDPGATNPVRNCRVPGSINLKQGRGSFAARLVEFHQDREYALEDICAALGVTPAPADTAEHRAIKIRDTGKDSVLQWLSDNNLVLSQVNSEGWCGVVCPNEGHHTDGNPEGRYKPLDRTYCCYHGHCQDLTTQAFLDWVAANGGPTVVSGLRDDLLAELHARTLDKLTPNETFTDEASARIKEVERKEAGRLERGEWFERYAYVQSDDSYFDVETRLETQRNVFNALFRHIDCKSIHNPKTRVQASIYYDERRQEYGAKALAAVTYAPGESVFVTRDGLVYGNKWVNARPDVSHIDAVADSDIERWLDHCRVLVPNDAELQHCLDAMAHKVQHPNIKINHAILHGGDDGCGKDTMWAPFIWAVAGPHHKNRTVVDNDGLASQWGYDLEAEIMILNELKEPEAKERRALANKLKPIIAAPPETLTVNRKGLHPYEMVNRVFVLAFTNDQVPITLPTQDRRWLALWSHAPRMAEGAGPAMWNWFKAGGYVKIAAWLHQRDVSRFDPSAPPMTTDYKLNLVEHSMSSAESYLVELMRDRKSVFANGVVGSPFHRLVDALQSRNDLPAGMKFPQAALLHAFKEAGWVDCGRLAATNYMSKKHVFAAPEIARSASKSELRRLADTIADGSGHVLKNL